MKAMVKNTAMGSFKPDSISSVAATRSLSRTPEDLSKEKTAAASVEPTIAPSSIAQYQSKPSKKWAATPVMPALSTTPKEAKVKAGRKPVRKVLNSVRKPPSSKMTASATLPTQ